MAEPPGTAPTMTASPLEAVCASNEESAQAHITRLRTRLMRGRGPGASEHEIDRNTRDNPWLIDLRRLRVRPRHGPVAPAMPPHAAVHTAREGLSDSEIVAAGASAAAVMLAFVSAILWLRGRRNRCDSHNQT